MIIRRILVSVFAACFLAACGGGGGSSGGDGIQLVQASVTVQDLPGGESVTVALNDGQDQITASSAGTFTFSEKVAKNNSYTLSVVTATAGTNCLFSNNSTSITRSNPGNESPVLGCQGGTGGTGGTGGGPASQISGPFKLYGWGADFLGGATFGYPVSLLDENDNPLTGAALSDFTFLDNDQEITDSPEFSLHVQPMPQSNARLNIALAIDRSGSLSVDDLNAIKLAAKDYVANQDAGTLMSVFSFDDTVTQEAAYTDDKTALEAAIDGIVRGNNSTDLYGAITDSANSLGYSLAFNGSLGYVVIVTDGVHTVNGDSPTETQDAVEDKLVYAVGVGDGFNEDDLSQAIGDPEGAGQTLFNVAAPSGVAGALDQISQTVESFVSGLHVVLYRSPRRGTGDHEFKVEATPLDDCAFITGPDDACIYFWEYSSDTLVEGTNLVIVPDIVNPEPGDVVTLRIPDWDFCDPTPSYQWNVTVNQGSATDTVIDGGQALELALGATAPIDVSIAVDDTASACAGNFTVNVP